MMRRSLRHPSAPEAHRVVRRWTLGVLIVYGVVALAAFGVEGARQHLAYGPSKAAASALTAAVATADARDQRDR
jgi:hypothetical protein